jgi:hypothetical protein
MFKLTLLALVALFAFSAAAEAIEVKKRREAPGTPAAVWEVVGGFCAIKNWHPAVAECEEITEGDDVFRILTLKDGGKIKERLTDKGDTSYSYEIVESPLPVKDYKATLKVGEDDEENRIEIVWKSEFDANGASDDEAKQVIVGIFEDGVKGIKKAALDLSDAKEDKDDGDDD